MKPRHGASVDSNQPAIVAALRAAGARVLVLDVSEEGAPDLCCGFLGSLTLLECKAGKGRLRPGQKTWHEEWAKAGIRVHLVRSIPEALRACGITGEAAIQRRRDMATLADALNEARGAKVGTAMLRPSRRVYR